MPYPRARVLGLLGIVLFVGCGKKRAAAVPEPLGVPSDQSSVPSGPTAANPGGAESSAPSAERRRLEERIQFGYDLWTLSAVAQAILDVKARALREEPQLRIRIEGHADERGSYEYNLVLSQKRATEAKRYLVQLGIDARRIETTGLGEEQPLDTGSNEGAWARNRRAEFRILPASGMP